MVAASSGLASDPEAEAAVETAAAAMRYAEEREAAAKAAALAAVSVPIPRVPGAVVVLINHLDVPRERIKQILIRWPRLLEVRTCELCCNPPELSRVSWVLLYVVIARVSFLGWRLGGGVGSRENVPPEQSELLVRPYGMC